MDILQETYYESFVLSNKTKVTMIWQEIENGRSLRDCTESVVSVNVNHVCVL